MPSVGHENGSLPAGEAAFGVGIIIMFVSVQSVGGGAVSERACVRACVRVCVCLSLFCACGWVGAWVGGWVAAVGAEALLDSSRGARQAGRRHIQAGGWLGQ